MCFHLMSLRRRRLLGPVQYTDLDMVTFDNLTVLHMPVFQHHLQTLHYLLQEFAGHPWINHKGGELGRTPLHYCCTCSFTDGLKLLLEFDADWKMTDQNGDTCLHLCFAYGDLAGLRELVKSIVAKCLRSLQDVVGEAQISGKEAILAELGEFEGTKNNHGFRAIDYAASFELQSQYKESRLAWVEAAFEEESILQKLRLENWDSVLAFAPSDTARNDSASLHPSTQSSASSLTAPDSASFAFSSAPKPSVLPEKNEETAKLAQARMHLASVGNDASHISPLDKLNSRRRSNTAAVHGYKPPPLPISINTGVASGSKSSVKMSSPVTPLLIDFPKTPSLKSVTISPSVRGAKRKPSINSMSTGTPEVLKENESLDEIAVPVFAESPLLPTQIPSASGPNPESNLPVAVTAVASPDPSQSSQNNSAESRRRSMSSVHSPPIRSSSFHFLPLGITRRRSATSAAPNGNSNAAAPSAPAEGIDGLRLSSPLSVETSRFSSRRSSLRRNISTPSVVHSLALGMSSANGSLETIPIQQARPERLFRHANASDSMIRSRPTSPTEASANDMSNLLDTIKLSMRRPHEAVPEDKVVHSFVASIPRDKLRRSNTTSPVKEKEPQLGSLVKNRPERSSTMSSLTSMHTQRDLNSIKLTRVRDD